MTTVEKVLLVQLNLIVFVWLMHKIKALFISGTVTISRETELQGESCVFQAQVYAFDSQDKIFERIQFLAEAAMLRKKFLFDRFQGILDAERAAKGNLALAKE